VLLAMLADIGILTAAFFGVKALIKARMGTGATLAVLFAALAAVSAASYAALMRFADKRYPTLGSNL